MVSAWWLLAAFWLGGCLGMLLTGLLAMSGKSSASDENEMAPDARSRAAIHRRY
jgi:hypothetical protein